MNSVAQKNTSYESAYNEAFPVVCIDEKPIVLHGEVREPIPMTDGQSKRKDYEYKRNGTANIFCSVEPKIVKYINSVTTNRSGAEFAKFLNEVSLQYTFAMKIVLVMDNLSTHREKIILEHLGEDVGTKLWSRFEVHHTPKQASWLN